MSDPIYIMQNSFTGGEFSPVMNARQDLQKYGSGLATMLNFYALPHGAAVNRPGTEFIAETKNSGKVARLVPFQFSTEQAYAIEFGEGYCRFYRNGGQVVSGGVPYEITTPYQEDELATLNFTQSADVLYIVHPKYPPKVLSRTSDTNWAITNFAYHDGPFMPVNLVEATTITPSDITGEITLTASAAVFDAAHVGALFKLEHDVEAQTATNSLTTSSAGYSAAIVREPSQALTVTLSGTWAGTVILEKSVQNLLGKYPSYSTEATYTASGTYVIPTSISRIRYRLRTTGITSGVCSASMVTPSRTVSTAFTLGTSTEVIKGKGDWSLITHGIWTATAKLQKSEDQGATWTTLRSYNSAGDYNMVASGTEDKVCLLRLFSDDFTSGTLRVDLSWYPFTVQGIVKITSVTDSTHATGTVLNEIGGIDATDIWYEGSWSDYRGYPSAVVFFQNRLIFANTKGQPQTLWGSKIGDYINFGISSPLVDDDAITTPLVSEQVNAIKALKALDKIIGFTSGGTWKIGAGGDSAAFTPTSQQATQQGYYGASALNPLTIGNRMLYSQDKGSGIRDIGYDFASDSYTGTDLTLLAEHLFRSRSIKQWAYQQEPNGIVWAVCDDGQLLGFTYLREQDVWGWHRHASDGTFESVCTIQGDDGDEIWFIVNRTIGGATKRYVEKLALRTYSTNVADQYFVDCGLSYNGSPIATFPGLSHLEGKTVAILADGNVMPQQVVTAGSVTIANTASIVHIGLPYTCDLETLNADFQARDGTIQTRIKNITKTTLRLENTRELFVGSSFADMWEIKLREDENYNEATRMYTGDISTTITSGSNKQGRVCLRVSNPVPVTVLAIVSEVTVGG